mmetsp:Transcript_3153/g.4776  ORF Transcript_3153/g.4776 Transcript_3153/m.4776 type:complete len:375 (+) Transcript_3153:130-1254(+)|eukprot:CAMPEP_0194226168 /NCGR_PEP_ID=MMETSP0156-20130528/41295_1 /TAXON_ID=33649 /ORGANISM="Thalassionema nitzschioides, Strain L26-B" /LENGTH=374 /DNA_ID=CAMNT_0038958429 /DNA_START=44 /DNA_END=1168 /DNA_ORIENTATION=-
MASRNNNSRKKEEQPPLKTVPRMVKPQVQDIGIQQPGAYNVAERPFGERPVWTQNQPRIPPRVQASPIPAVIVNDAEVVIEAIATNKDSSHVNNHDMEVETANAEEIVRASVVVESRLKGFSRKLRDRLVRKARRKRDERQTEHEEEPTTRLQDVAARSPATYYNNSSKEIQGKRRTTASLIDDDDESTEEEPISGISNQATNARFGTILEMEEFNEMHPHVQSVLEVFPDTDIRHVQQLLRQHSLSTAFITLAEESSAPPSDEVLPPSLQHTTTYAQASDENRAIIISYLTEMFPTIPENQIVGVLMKYSTHKGVAILSGEGEELLQQAHSNSSSRDDTKDTPDMKRQDIVEDCKPPAFKKRKSGDENDDGCF